MTTAVKNVALIIEKENQQLKDGRKSLRGKRWSCFFPLSAMQPCRIMWRVLTNHM